MNTENKIYLAPFQGITTHTFCRVYSRHFKNINKYYTPFFTKIDHETRLSSRKEHELQHLDSTRWQVIPQILSKDPAEILRFARICENRGFNELNWNLGCPYPQVADKKRGSGLLPYPAMISDILEKVMPEINIRFSIKCRLGYDSPDEINQLIPVFNNFSIHELTIHGRIGRQLYSGKADNDALSRIAPLLNIPLVHNGDVNTTDDFVRASAILTGVNRWMIGRGILGNPFLAEDIQTLNEQHLHGNTGTKTNPDNPLAPNNPVEDVLAESEERKARLRSFIDDLYYAYRVDMNNRLTILNVLKEYWDYLVVSFDDPQKVKRIIKKVKTFDEYESAVNAIFDF